MFSFLKCRLWTLSIVLASTSLWTPLLKAQGNALRASHQLEPRVSFWEKIFSRYDSKQTIIHDLREPWYIIDIVSFSSDKNKAHSQSKTVAAYMKRYRLALKRFARLGRDALKYGQIEKRLYHVFSRDSQRVRDLFAGKIRLRIQSGMKDEFKRAVARARSVIGYMEKIFRQVGVPTMITRLAFVESMFNYKAKSRAGAAGIWQFMPKTGKQFLVINRYIDERKSIYKSTRAAAKLLLINYRYLGSWPLAITAYNHGMGSIAKAVKKTGSSRVEDLIENYKGRSFGFASKNFYAEFLAAANIYKGYQETSTQSKSLVIPIKLNHRFSVKEFLSQFNLNSSVVRKFNPDISSGLFGGGSKVKLPNNFEVFLPKNLAFKSYKFFYKNYSKQQRISQLRRRELR